MPSSSDLGAKKTASTKTKSNSITKVNLGVIVHVPVIVHVLCNALENELES